MPVPSDNILDEVSGSCPYCGEPISVVIDLSPGDQHYIEDCEVCCQPMIVLVSGTDSDCPNVQFLQENDIP